MHLHQGGQRELTAFVLPAIELHRAVMLPVETMPRSGVFAGHVTEPSHSTDRYDLAADRQVLACLLRVRPVGVEQQPQPRTAR